MQLNNLKKYKTFKVVFFPAVIDAARKLCIGCKYLFVHQEKFV